MMGTVSFKNRNVLKRYQSIVLKFAIFYVIWPSREFLFASPKLNIIFVEFITSGYSRKFSTFGPVSRFVRQPSRALESFLHLALYFVYTGGTRLTLVTFEKTHFGSELDMDCEFGFMTRYLFYNVSTLEILSRHRTCPFHVMHVWPP